MDESEAIHTSSSAISWTMKSLGARLRQKTRKLEKVKCLSRLVMGKCIKPAEMLGSVAIKRHHWKLNIWKEEVIWRVRSQKKVWRRKKMIINRIMKANIVRTRQTHYTVICSSLTVDLPPKFSQWYTSHTLPSYLFFCWFHSRSGFWWFWHSSTLQLMFWFDTSKLHCKIS